MTATSVIHKFPMQSGGAALVDPVRLNLPAGKVLTITRQYARDLLPTVWLLRPLGESGTPDDMIVQYVEVIGTGYPIQLDGFDIYLGTVVGLHGEYVTHAFLRSAAAPEKDLEVSS